MGLYPFLPSAPALTQSATVYVTTNGNDANNGLSWQTAFATLQHAVNSLLTVNGVTLGTVQLGPGTFAPATVSATQSITINGAGSGSFYDATNNQTNPQYTTIINNPGGAGTDALTIAGASNFGPGGGVTNTGVTISNLAITGNASSRYGLNITNTEGVRLTNVNIDQHGVFGIRQSKVFGVLLSTVYITRCGTAGSAVPSGGHFLDTAVGPNPGVTYLAGSQCGFNTGFGVYDAGTPSTSTGFTATQAIFSNTAASAMAGSGCGIFAGGQYQVTGCDFEANALYGVAMAAGSQFSATGCDFLGDGVSTAGIFNGNGGGGIPVVVGCKFAGHSTYSIVNTSTNFASWAACVSTDPSGFINSGAAVGVVPADGFAPAVTGSTGGIISGNSPQTVSANQAITINASWGYNAILLNANVTATTCPVGPPGEHLHLAYIQGAGGNHTYVWPSGCRFSGGVTPTASTVAGRIDAQEFVSNGVVWQQYPALNVPNA